MLGELLQYPYWGLVGHMGIKYIGNVEGLDSHIPYQEPQSIRGGGDKILTLRPQP